MNRRHFITLLGGAAAAWPLAARAQQTSVPVIGFLSSQSAPVFTKYVASFRRALDQAGFADGRDVTIEYRWSEGQADRLPGMVADLVRRQVAVIVTTNTQSAMAAKGATQAIPIVFQVGADPVELGLVTSLNRPSTNATGLSVLNTAIAAKRLQMLYELVPSSRSVAVLTNSANAALAQPEIQALRGAAQTLGLEVSVLRASDRSEIEAAFANLGEQRAGALLVSADPTFIRESDLIVALARRYAIPAMYQYRESTVAGGLASYGASLLDQYRQLGVYASRILKGEKPGELPVQQSTKFELLINLKTARALGITVPTSLLAVADEVIE